MKSLKPGVVYTPPTRSVSAKPLALKAKPQAATEKLMLDIRILERDGSEYLGLKADMERMSARMEKLRANFEPHLMLVPDRRFPIGEKELQLIERESTSCPDLAKAKKKLGELLLPYIENIEKLDIKAAKKHLGEKLLNPFLKVDVSFSLKTPDLKRVEDGGDDE